LRAAAEEPVLSLSKEPATALASRTLREPFNP